jgi:hypothetical protein
MKAKYLITYPLHLLFTVLIYIVCLFLAAKWKYWSLRQVDEEKISRNKSGWGFLLHEINKWEQGLLL